MKTKIKPNTPFEEFFLLEKEKKLFSLKYKNVYYWQLVRFGLLKNIARKDIKVVNQSIRRSIIKEIVGSIKESHRMQRAEKGITTCDIVRIRPCVTISNDGRNDDHQYDYVDLSSKYNVLDIYALGAYYNIPDTVQYDMAPAEMDLIFWKIKRKIFGEEKISEEQRKLLQDFLCEINYIYGTKFNVNVLETQIEYLVNCHIAYIKYYKKIFLLSNPKIVMLYPHYDSHMFAAISAAKDMSIKVIEIQHSRINSHEAYWYEDNTVLGKLLPDYFFVYGQWWKEQIKLPEFCNVQVVGNPYLETQTKKYTKKEDKSNKTIAVFSNPQNGKDLSEMIYSLNDYWEKHNIKVLFKLHPNECEVWRKEYPKLKKIHNVTIIDDNTSVYKVLSEADIAIAINSTVLYEALAYPGISLMIYTIGDYAGMQFLIDYGMASAVKNKEEIICTIERLFISEYNINNTLELWKSDSVKNYIKKIMEIINEV